MSGETFRRGGIYRRRWQLWYPWDITDPWRPRIFRGADEWCNESIALILPLLGGLCIFWRPGRLRVLPCVEDWARLTDPERADYAPCGRLAGGRSREAGHAHWETEICLEAHRWLDDLPLPYA